MQFRILIACTVLIIAFVAIELVQETQAGALTFQTTPKPPSSFWQKILKTAEKYFKTKKAM
ncbi:unnamed protein product [Heterobilharzia americana]|nr:unnamed protein product [Heterobilharzia americana]